jgi:hypothetical protein
MAQHHVRLTIVGDKVVAVKPSASPPLKDGSDSAGSDQSSAAAPSIQPDIEFAPSDHEPETRY